MCWGRMVESRSRQRDGSNICLLGSRCNGSIDLAHSSGAFFGEPKLSGMMKLRFSLSKIK